ncbi:hypothetical protein [Bradyrhizobium sp. RDM4]|uniref:hypothetical protein n=1 Tax=Bradyrhizobium sp. RDM4 TaxID=3378765 RepID=UPI0038FC52AB
MSRSITHRELQACEGITVASASSLIPRMNDRITELSAAWRRFSRMFRIFYAKMINVSHAVSYYRPVLAVRISSACKLISL